MDGNPDAPNVVPKDTPLQYTEEETVADWFQIEGSLTGLDLPRPPLPRTLLM